MTGKARPQAAVISGFPVVRGGTGTSDTSQVRARDREWLAQVA